MKIKSIIKNPPTHIVSIFQKPLYQMNFRNHGRNSIQITKKIPFKTYTTTILSVFIEENNQIRTTQRRREGYHRWELPFDQRSKCFPPIRTVDSERIQQSPRSYSGRRSGRHHTSDTSNLPATCRTANQVLSDTRGHRRPRCTSIHTICTRRFRCLGRRISPLACVCRTRLFAVWIRVRNRVRVLVMVVKLDPKLVCLLWRHQWILKRFGV